MRARTSSVKAGVAGRAVAVAEDDVGARLPAPPSPCAPLTAFIEWQSMCQLRRSAHASLRSACASGVVVRAVVALDPAADLLDAELAARRSARRRRACARSAPCRAAALPLGTVLVRPAAAFDQLEVDVAGMAGCGRCRCAARSPRAGRRRARSRGSQSSSTKQSSPSRSSSSLTAAPKSAGKSTPECGEVEDQRRARLGRPVQDGRTGAWRSWQGAA